MASGFTLKVSPGELKSKAQEITTQINKVQQDWNKLSSLVNNSKSYWEGDAGDAFRKLKKEQEDDVTNIIKRMKEHPKDLLSMANIYVEAEEEAAQLSNSLPEDIIV